MDCSICKGDIRDDFGHNAQPINNGRCCDMCNTTFVIPCRIKEASMQNVISELSNVGLTILCVVVAVIVVRWLDRNVFNKNRRK